MKRTLKMMAMLLCVAALSITTACTKEGEDSNTNGGSGNGGNSATIAYPFSLGYYHPEKKVKKVTVYQTDNSYDEWKSTYYFTWNGNDLDSITFYHYYTCPSYGLGDDECNGYYCFSYNEKGYINTVHSYLTHHYIDSEDYTVYDNVDTIRYKKEGDFGHYYYIVWIGDSDFSLWNPSYYSSYVNGYLFAYDTNGILESYNKKEVLLDNKGNIIEYNGDGSGLQYDNKKNPFKDLIFRFNGINSEGGFLQYTWSNAVFVCPNNNLFRDRSPYDPVTYEYSGDYPISITYGNQRMEIEYY